MEKAEQALPLGFPKKLRSVCWRMKYANSGNAYTEREKLGGNSRNGISQNVADAIVDIQKLVVDRRIITGIVSRD